MAGVLLIWRSFEAPPGSATLVISVDSEAVEVSVDDEPIGIAEATLPLVREVYPGKYQIRVVGKGGRQVVKQVEVKGDEVRALHFGD